MRIEEIIQLLMISSQWVGSILAVRPAISHYDLEPVVLDLPGHHHQLADLPRPDAASPLEASKHNMLLFAVIVKYYSKGWLKLA